MIAVLRQRAVKHTLLRLVTISTKIKKMKRTEYYFGYGANLSIDRFVSRKMNVKEIGNSILIDHEIKFTLANEYLGKGYAGVHYKQNEKVFGVTYKIDLLSLALLDTLEWCGFGAYERKKVNVEIMETGEIVDAWCYFVKYPKDGLFPSKLYISNMIKTAKERNFPDTYIKFLENQESKERFEIDHGFSLLFYGKRRFFEKKLKPFYKFHDRIQEKICDLI